MLIPTPTPPIKFSTTYICPPISFSVCPNSPLLVPAVTHCGRPIIYIMSMVILQGNEKVVVIPVNSPPSPKGMTRQVGEQQPAGARGYDQLPISPAPSRGTPSPSDSGSRTSPRRSSSDADGSPVLRTATLSPKHIAVGEISSASRSSKVKAGEVNIKISSASGHHNLVVSQIPS
jgi:hypothetical protein